MTVATTVGNEVIKQMTVIAKRMENRHCNRIGAGICQNDGEIGGHFHKMNKIMIEIAIIDTKIIKELGKCTMKLVAASNMKLIYWMVLYYKRYSIQAHR